MPSAGDNGCFAFRTGSSKEIDGFMVLICKSDGDYHVSDTYVEFRNNEAGDVKLFQCDLSAFFYFCLIFSVFGIL